MDAKARNAIILWSTIISLGYTYTVILISKNKYILADLDHALAYVVFMFLIVMILAFAGVRPASSDVPWIIAFPACVALLTSPRFMRSIQAHAIVSAVICFYFVLYRFYGADPLRCQFRVNLKCVLISVAIYAGMLKIGTEAFQYAATARATPVAPPFLPFSTGCSPYPAPAPGPAPMSISLPSPSLPPPILL